MSTTSRKDIKTVGIWTLQRRELGDGEYTYTINAESKSAVNLYINDMMDFGSERMTYTVEYSANSRPMDLEEAADFVAHAQYALVAATEFQRAIDSADNN